MPSPAGPSIPGTISSDSSGADGAWQNTSNATGEDGTFTTTPGLTGTSSILSAKGLGFSIPSTTLIQGIVVARRGKASSASSAGGGKRIVDDLFDLVGLPTSSSKALTSTGNRWLTTNGYSNFSNADPTLVYGASNDLWGNNSGDVLYSHINNANYGNRLRVTGNVLDGTEIASVDNFKHTVYYADVTTTSSTTTTTTTTPAPGGVFPHFLYQQMGWCLLGGIFTGRFLETRCLISRKLNRYPIFKQVRYAIWQPPRLELCHAILVRQRSNIRYPQIQAAAI